MHPTQSVQRTHPIQATHLVHATHARHATHSRAATHITVSRLAITPTLPAVPAEPATATLPAVATDPATATLPAVAADPATATLPAAATDPATKTLSMPAIDPTTWPLSTATAESHESAIGPSCQPRDHSRRMRSALPWAIFSRSPGAGVPGQGCRGRWCRAQAGRALGHRARWPARSRWAPLGGYPCPRPDDRTVMRPPDPVRVPGSCDPPRAVLLSRRNRFARAVHSRTPSALVQSRRQLTKRLLGALYAAPSVGTALDRTMFRMPTMLSTSVCENTASGPVGARSATATLRRVDGLTVGGAAVTDE